MAGQPIILGQHEQQAQAMGSQIFLNLYLALVPMVTQSRLSQGYPDPATGITEHATPDRITAEAEELTHSAMARIGFKRERS